MSYCRVISRRRPVPRQMGRVLRSLYSSINLGRLVAPVAVSPTSRIRASRRTSCGAASSRQEEPPLYEGHHCKMPRLEIFHHSSATSRPYTELSCRRDTARRRRPINRRFRVPHASVVPVQKIAASSVQTLYHQKLESLG